MKPHTHTPPAYAQVRLPMPHMGHDSALRPQTLATHRWATLQLAEMCVAAAPEDIACVRFLANRRTKWFELPRGDRERAMSRFY
jgi:hypothetical protein